MKTLTEEQRRAVETRGKVIVTASAGSGKTFVMIERLMQRILREGVEVDKILALTFTNKAAAQMRDKLRRALLDAARGTDTEQKRAAKRQLEKLPLAEIGTFHAFCARIVRSYFYLAGVDPSFAIISPDDARGKALSSRALAETFDSLYEEDSADLRALLAVYFRRKKDRFLRELVCSLHAAVRGEQDYRARLEQAGGESFERVEKDLFEVYRARIGGLYADLPAVQTPRAVKVAQAIGEGCRALLAGGLFDAAAAAGAIAVPAMPPNRAEGEERVRLRRLSEISREFRGVLGELKSLAPREVEAARFSDASSRARALGKLVLRYDDAFSALKRENNVLDYNDLEHCALAVLSDPAARAAIAGSKELVLVDEYQDVNAVQEALLNLLAGEELFLVGDAKQAIYGFRGSNAAFFNDKVREFGDGALPLTGNFRSADAVLEAVNRIFSPLIAGYLPVHGGGMYGEHRGEVCFHRYKEEPRERKERGVYSVAAAETSEEEDALALRVLAIVERELGESFFDIGTGETRHVRCGDIAVLARKNSGDAERIVRTLSRYNIPVTTSSKVNVFDFFESNLLLNLLSYLDDPAQDIALTASLLSAVGGLCENDLVAVRTRFPRDKFRDACRKYATYMADPVAVRLQSFYARMEGLARRACVRNAGEIAGELLAEGLEAQIAALPDGPLRLARVRRLIAETEDLSLHDFLDKLRAADYRIEYAETGGENAVKVLTMHASKGLEYPVVILASMDTPFHGADRDEAMWSREYGFAPKSYDTERKISHETLLRRLTAELAERKEREEECNLLYVAMTRAQYRLHVLFGERETRTPWRPERFSDFIDLDDCAGYFVGEYGQLPPLGRRQLVYQKGEEVDRAAREIVAAMHTGAPAQDVPVKSSATELMRLLHAEERSDAERADPQEQADRERTGSGHTAEEGSAYHAFLEHVEFGRDARAEKERMAREGTLPPEQLALLDDARLCAILDIPCLRNLAGKRVWRERKFLVSFPASDFPELFSSNEEIVFQGAMDLIVLDENGYTIVDYKDSALGGDALARKYALQMRLYRKTLAKIFRVSPDSVRVRIVNIARCEETEI